MRRKSIFTRPLSARRPDQCRPRLEQLEDRTVLDRGAGEELYPIGFKRDDGSIRGWMDREYLFNNNLILDYNTFLTNELKGLVPADDKGPVDPGERADVLVNNDGTGTTSGFTQSETTVVAFGNNVVVGFNDSGSFVGGASKFTGYAFSTDGGVTFTDGGTLPTSAVGDAGDPVMARDETTGRIYFSTLGFNSPGNIQMFRSDDNGQTWQAPVNATPGGSSEDKQWHVVDNFAGAGRGNVYVISRRFGSTGGGPGIYVFRSTDGGATFGPTNGVQITPGAQGAFIEVLPDHSVAAFWFAGATLQMRRSTDFGATFGAPVTVATGLTGGVNGDLALTGIRQGLTTASGFRSNEFPHVAVNRASGHIYVTYDNNPAGTDKADVFLVMSTNNGATWSAPFKVNDDVTTTDQWQPTIAASPDGTKVGVFYSSRQEDPANNLFKHYGRVASISGATLTWAPSFAVSEVASLPEFGRDSVVNSVYMGDYNHAAATNTAFHVVWSDNRDNLTGGAPRKDPDIFYKKIAITNPTGPFVVTATPVGQVTPAVSSYTVTFDRDIDASTFTTDDLVSFNGPGGSLLGAITGVTPLTARQFRIDFASQAATGQYTIVFGPNILDTLGNPMDQDGDETAGEAIEDRFTGTFGITGPKVTTAVPTGLQAGPVTSIRVTFDRAMDVSSFATTDFGLTGPGGAVVITTVTPVGGSGDTQFDVAFNATATGTYTFTAGPTVTDTFGNQMDQDGDLIPGEVPQDRFSSTFQISAPRVTAATPTGAQAGPVSSITYTFSKTIDATTFTTDDVFLFNGPGGVNLLPTLINVFQLNATQFRLDFTGVGATGLYTVTIGPDIRDALGNQMDQDNDLIPGETPSDRFTSTFSITAPRVTASTPATGSVIAGPISSVTFTFSKAIDAATFNTADVFAFTGPGGVNLLPTLVGVTPLSATQLRVDFAATNADGAYSMTIGPDIRDTLGNQMDQDNDLIPGETPSDRFTVTFNLNILGPDGFGYTGRLIAPQDINLVPGGAGVFVILDGVDDSFTTLNLGANTFNLYGFTVTGNNQLFVSSNGIVTLGTGESSFSNGNLTTLPTQRTLAPFWDDLHTGRNANDQILGRFDGLGDADPLNDRLIIEWNDVEHFSFGGTATFQAILQLNRGVNTSDVIFNYVDLVFGNAAVDNGASASTGIKDVGTQGANRLLANQNTATSPFVGDGKAILWAAPPFGSTVTGQKFNDLDRDGVRDGNEPTLANWQVYIDLDSDGVLDAGEPTRFTDATGTYTFTEVVPGANVQVREVVQPGWVQTAPQSAGAYSAAATTFENLDLVDGGAGVFLILDNVDDSTAGVNLGANTFRMFNTTYTGAQLFVSSNALLTFLTANADLSNGDLTATPAQAAIAPFWDDLHTGRNANDKILGRFDGIGDADPNNDRLVVEWNDVEHFSFGGAATFQAILQLNTPGGANGVITVNYVDTVFGNIAVDDAASASVGIKGVGTQGPNRVLVTANATNTLVGSGKAIRFTSVSGPGPHVINLPIRTTATGRDFGNFRNAVPVKLVDNAHFGFRTVGAWALVSGGHLGSYRTIAGNGTGSLFAQWLYGDNFTAGTSYEFFATWVADASNATNARYKIFQGATQLGTVFLDQTQTPDTTLVNGSLWKSLFVYTPATSGYQVIRIQVDNSGNGRVVADAIFDPPIGGEGAGDFAASPEGPLAAVDSAFAEETTSTSFAGRRTASGSDLAWAMLLARELLSDYSSASNSTTDEAPLTAFPGSSLDAAFALLADKRADANAVPVRSRRGTAASTLLADGLTSEADAETASAEVALAEQEPPRG